MTQPYSFVRPEVEPVKEGTAKDITLFLREAFSWERGGWLTQYTNGRPDGKSFLYNSQL